MKPEKWYVVNPDDLADVFWKHIYIIELTGQGVPFIVNADHESDAFDYIIDYCEEYLPGLLWDEDEAYAEEFIDEYICGGNHGRYLNTYNISIKEII